MDEFSKIETAPQETIPRFAKKKRGPLLPYLLPTAAILSGLLAAIALPEILGADSWLGYLKAAVIALLATMIAYGVNRLAIDRGAFLAARGMMLAFILSLGTIFTAGTGFWMATYPGLVIKEVETLRLQDFASDLRDYIRGVIQSSETSAQVVPLLGGIIADLEDRYACELDDGCISSRDGGPGSTSSAIESRRQQAQSIADTVDALERSRGAAAAQLSGLESAFQTTIVDENLSLSERRIKLQELQGAIDRQLSRLQKSVPTAVIAAYAEDLKNGALINGNPRASSTLSSVLEGYGRALERVITQAEQQAGTPPAFPAKTGVADTLSFVWHFLPVAIIVAVCELVFPASLWMYTFFAYSARVQRPEDTA